MIYFYTAVYGDHIALPEFDTQGFEFRCYTDRKIESKTWKIIDTPPIDPTLNPRMAAKYHKMFPPVHPLWKPDDISIWIDASITVTDVAEMARVCAAALKGHDVALFRHPERDNIYDEAAVSATLPKYAGLPLMSQVAAYRQDELPPNVGLWAGGVIVRWRQGPCFEASWWAENIKWSYQDQLSLPYALWKNNVVPGVIPGSVYGTDFHTWQPTADPIKLADLAAAAVPVVESTPNLNPLLSLITPTHNPKWLVDCWKSLQQQTYTNFEWLISVNNKNAKRMRIAQLASEVRTIVGTDPRIRIIEDFSPFSHVGQRKAFAFEQAKGDVVIEFDHDDILVPEALHEIAAAFAAPAVGFVYSDFADFHDGAADLQGNLTYRSPLTRQGWVDTGFKFYDADIAGIRPGRYECVTAPEGALAVSHIYTAPNHVRAWRRSVYEAIGGHNSELAVADDHELVVRTYLATRFHHIAKPLYLYRISGENTWAQNVDKIKTTSDQTQYDYLERLVLRECTLLGVPAIELGGGIDPRPGWTAADLQDAPIIADLNKRWPWADGSVGAFRASDLLEHLPDKMHTMSEIHRCLRPGGWLLSMTPSAEGIGAFMDPTHVSYWVAPSFWYYTRPTSARYIRNTTMMFREVHLETVQINVQGVNVPYVRADLVKL